MLKKMIPIALLCAGSLALGGCAGGPVLAGAAGAGTGAAVASGVAAVSKVSTAIDVALQAADIAYTTGSIALAGYEALTPCGEPGAKAICFDQNIDYLISTSLTALKKVAADARAFKATDGDPTAIAATVVKATVDLLTILSQYGVNKL